MKSKAAEKEMEAWKFGGSRIKSQKQRENRRLPPKYKQVSPKRIFLLKS